MNNKTNSIFVYGTLRKDYLDLRHKGQNFAGDYWNATKEAKAEYGYISGFKLYQVNGCYYPFIVPSENERVFGIILTWPESKFSLALEECNDIEGYDENGEDNLYERKIVEVHEDVALKIFVNKAYVYFQPWDRSKLDDCINAGKVLENKSFDWFKWDGINDLRLEANDKDYDFDWKEI